MVKYTKQQAISIIVNCAEKYKENLDGYQLLFILSDKHRRVSSLEVYFNSYNFLHLTGIKLNDNITAIDFYNRCLDHKLNPDIFSFSDDGTTQLKLAVLPQLMVKDLSAKMVGNYDGSNPKLYTEKLVGNIRACMGFKKTPNQINVPNTVLNVDLRAISNIPLRVIATYRKHNTDVSIPNLYIKLKRLIGHQLHIHRNGQMSQNQID